MSSYDRTAEEAWVTVPGETSDQMIERMELTDDYVAVAHAALPIYLTHSALEARAHINGRIAGYDHQLAVMALVLQLAKERSATHGG